MKRFISTWLVLALGLSVLSQPPNFSWQNRHGGRYNYISDAKDQKEPGPCNIFASVAAVEAIAQIYFNKDKDSLELDLSESQIYSKCCSSGCGPGAANITESLDFLLSDGVVDNNCLPYPDSADPINNCYYRDTCLFCETPSYLVSIPGSQLIQPLNDSELKRAIMEHGPIIAVLDPAICNVLHPGNCSDENHTILIIGWEASSSTFAWRIKDSWPGDAEITSVVFDIFDYTSYLYYVKALSDENEMDCIGDGCTIFNSRSCWDHDQDGFYNWGIGEKPSNLNYGPTKMDFDDNDASVISLDENYIPCIPTISGSEYVCESGGTFQFNNKPAGFVVSWSVTSSVYFNTPTSGTDTVATVYPKSSELMKLCTIIFTIEDTINSWTKQYGKSFFINGPNPNQISVSVEDSYGGTPSSYSGIWLLCPNSTYYFYLNNTSNCSTWDYNWSIPAAWTFYYQYNNYVSIYTNDQAWGTVDVYAKTCCYNDQGDRIKIKTQYFSEDDCGEYFLVYPNPTSDKFTLYFKNNFDLNSTDKSLEIYDIYYNTIFILKDFSKENIIETATWNNGLYLIRLKYKGRYFTGKIKINH